MSLASRLVGVRHSGGDQSERIRDSNPRLRKCFRGSDMLATGSQSYPPSGPLVARGVGREVLSRICNAFRSRMSNISQPSKHFPAQHTELFQFISNYIISAKFKTGCEGKICRHQPLQWSNGECFGRQAPIGTRPRPSPSA